MIIGKVTGISIARNISVADIIYCNAKTHIVFRVNTATEVSGEDERSITADCCIHFCNENVRTTCPRLLIHATTT